MSPEAAETSVTDTADHCDSTADFYLVSSDHVRFAVHTSSLQAGSGVFRDMLACGKPSKDEANETTVVVPETAEIFRPLLDFMSCKPGDFRISTIQRTESGMSFLYRLVTAVDKYAIHRGVDLIGRAFLLSVLQNQQSPILKQLVFGYAFGVRLGDDAIEEVALDQIKKATPDISDLEDAVKIASDSGFAEETLRLVNFFLRAYVKIATLRRDLTAQLHDEGFGGDEDDWDDTESLSDAKCRIRMLDSWNSSAKFISVEPLKRFMDEQDDSATGCTCGECGSQTDRLLGEYFEGVTDIWDGEVR